MYIIKHCSYLYMHILVSSKPQTQPGPLLPFPSFPFSITNFTLLPDCNSRWDESITAWYREEGYISSYSPTYEVEWPHLQPFLHCCQVASPSRLCPCRTLLEHQVTSTQTGLPVWRQPWIESNWITLTLKKTCHGRCIVLPQIEENQTQPVKIVYTWC